VLQLEDRLFKLGHWLADGYSLTLLVLEDHLRNHIVGFVPLLPRFDEAYNLSKEDALV
jgi:hypothetical protein